MINHFLRMWRKRSVLQTLPAFIYFALSYRSTSRSFSSCYQIVLHWLDSEKTDGRPVQNAVHSIFITHGICYQSARIQCLFDLKAV